MPARARRITLAIAALGLAAGGIAIWLFPRALPTVAVEQQLTRSLALQRADSFFRARAPQPAGARTALRFTAGDSLITFVDLMGGGHDTLNALVRGHDVAPFAWSVRSFVPHDTHEASVDFAPDGRIIGFKRTFAEADQRPDVGADSGRVLAEQVLAGWLHEPAAQWRLVTSSYDTRKTSGRVDRTYTFERTARRVAGAPIRTDIVIAGDTPSLARPYVDIPESFRRRYGEMRSANGLLTIIDTIAVLALVIAAAVTLRKYSKVRSVRWRPALTAGAVIGVLLLAAGLNELPGSWFSYHTEDSPVVFQATMVGAALFGGAGMALVVGLTLAAAEAAARHAFPEQLDWWKLWKYRGTREVTGRVAGGYAVAIWGFAYVALFYLITRNVFGWWVPSEMLDDPNLIASPVPWVSGVGMSLQAGVWEEALFRALPLSLLSLWVGTRPRRTWWMAAGVVASALVFGFAHSSYESWPPYSRGVEIFVDACLWGVLFLSFGVIVTMVAHFVYDLVLFGLFAASGSAPEYRTAAAVIVVALLAPALAVAWRVWRQRGYVPLDSDARAGAWSPEAAAEAIEVLAITPDERSLTVGTRRAALVAALAAVLLAVASPARQVLGRQFTATRAQALAAADSALRAHGGDPAGWTRLANTATDTLEAWPRFLREHHLERAAPQFAACCVPPAWWTVRYVHTTGALHERAEEWRIRLWPDGSRLDARHIIPESARRDSVSDTGARAIARAALAGACIDTAPLHEVKFDATARPLRRDVTITYVDSSVALPAGAAAHVWVTLAGNEPLVVRRGVELPETFLRSDRETQTSHMLLAGLSGLLVIVLIAGGAVFVVRLRPALVDDGALDTRAMLAFIGALSVLGMASSLNSLPQLLFLYDTTMPWSTFMASTSVQVLMAVFVSAIVYGLWLALGALRRRAGIPMLVPASQRTRGGEHDVLLAGLGLGGTLALLQFGTTLATDSGLPGVPQTVLTLALPWLGDAFSIPMGAVTGVAGFAIPALVIAGLSGRRAVRVLLIILLFALLGGAVASAGGAHPEHPGFALAFGLAALVAGGVAIRWWGGLCAWSWLIGVLAARAFGALHEMVGAPSGSGRAAGAVALAVSVALLFAISRRVSARPDRP
jgi:membrane protease YdiL (CAAX protease family)